MTTTSNTMSSSQPYDCNNLLSATIGLTAEHMTASQPMHSTLQHSASDRPVQFDKSRRSLSKPSGVRMWVEPAAHSTMSQPYSEIIRKLQLLKQDIIKPNNTSLTPGHVAMLTNQMLVYKHRRVIPRTESVAKMPKLNRKINLGISSDLGITNPRFIRRF